MPSFFLALGKIKMYINFTISVNECTGSIHDRIRLLFEMFDTEHKGQLTRDQFKAMLK